MTWRLVKLAVFIGLCIVLCAVFLVVASLSHPSLTTTVGRMVSWSVNQMNRNLERYASAAER